MLAIGGIVSGQVIADQIGPKWQNKKRFYYHTGNRKINAAIPLIKTDKWEEASAIWSGFANVSRPSLRYKIEYNLALASEMTGDINKAITWANQSLATKSSLRTRKY